MKIYVKSWYKDEILNTQKNGGYECFFDDNTGRYFLSILDVREYVAIKSWNFEIDIDKSKKNELAKFIIKNKDYLELREDKNE